MWKNNTTTQEPQQDSMTFGFASAVMIKDFRGGSVVFWISSVWSSALRLPYLFLISFKKEGLNKVLPVQTTPFFMLKMLRTWIIHEYFNATQHLLCLLQFTINRSYEGKKNAAGIWVDDDRMHVSWATLYILS